MGRPGYMSLYADERTQQIFDEFVKIKGITKSTALSEMLEIYMLCQDEELYMELKKKSLGIETAKQVLLQRTDKNAINDYIFMKLGMSSDIDGNPMDGEETIRAYIENAAENGLGYTWFSTQSLHFGMAKKKVDYYNDLIELGETVKILFQQGLYTVRCVGGQLQQPAADQGKSGFGGIAKIRKDLAQNLQFPYQKAAQTQQNHS